MMRTMSVFGVTLLVSAVIIWLMCAFVSGIWNPMLWEAIGRFLFVVIVAFVGGPIAGAAAAAYNQHLTDMQKKG